MIRMTLFEFNQLDDDEQHFLCERLGIQLVPGRKTRFKFKKTKKPLKKATTQKNILSQL